ncbi:hypothetical protein Tco_1067762 [Tanacetum coccineum]|uniref:Uncharacterized protein n=1 Tax=Tanacetum coccineum TaxID=301880 RepID=A0ABQ5HDT3_9ASTR
MGAQTQGRRDHEMEADFKFTTVEDVSTANVSVNTAGVEISTASPKVKTASVSVDDVDIEGLVYIRRSAAKRKDKGKAIMEESNPTQTKTKLQQEQERLEFEEALRLQEQFDEEERQRIASLAHRLQAQERERYSEADKAKLLVELINERKRQFAQQRAQQRRNMPLTQAQQRSYMFLFEATVKRVNTFTLMESDDTVPKVVVGSSKRSAEEELGEESSKRQRIREGSEPAAESKDKESDEFHLVDCMLYYAGSVEGCSIAHLQLCLLSMGPFFILDKLGEVAESPRLSDKMKVVYDQSYKEEASFAALMRDLYCSLWVSLSKKRRLEAELEGLEEQGDAVRALENMKEIVVRDSVTLGDLEQLLARAQVGVDLKDGYLAEVEEKV